MGKTINPAVAVKTPNFIIFTSIKFESISDTQKKTDKRRNNTENFLFITNLTNY